MSINLPQAVGPNKTVPCSVLV
uniref:Uncharacterized protein n=1 Tax=Arundo donax TaxID=35708 RepID=A0A0A9AC49_ARUDO